uniref:Uncharacterized protein n=1 Tax=Zea mays TaxID=4577 RepID=C0PFR2_MAIZE|nr:unknown [Zea mays]
MQISRGKPWGWAVARGEHSAQRHQPVSPVVVAAAAKMAIGRWAIWGFRVSDVRAGLVDFIFPFACGWVRACG